jgi:hypothetical protein
MKFRENLKSWALSRKEGKRHIDKKRDGKSEK